MQDFSYIRFKDQQILLQDSIQDRRQHRRQLRRQNKRQGCIPFEIQTGTQLGAEAGL